jgi:hypothetical protein
MRGIAEMRNYQREIMHIAECPRHSTLPNVLSIALLQEDETYRCSLDVDAEEEPEFDEILDGKLSSETLDDAL